METSYLILFLFLALAAEFFGTIGGFGSSVFFVPIAGLFLDFQSVLGITAIFHVVSNLSKIALFRHGVDRFLLVYMGVPSVIFVILGAFLSKITSGFYLEIILAVFLILLSLIFLFVGEIKLKPNRSNAFTGGTLSGLMAGMVGTGGAIRGIVLSVYNLPAAVFISTSAFIDLGIDVSRSVVYTTNGYVHLHDLYLIPFLIGISFLGTYLGKLLLARTPQDTFKRFTLILILFTGIITLIKLSFF